MYVLRISLCLYVVMYSVSSLGIDFVRYVFLYVFLYLFMSCGRPAALYMYFCLALVRSLCISLFPYSFL